MDEIVKHAFILALGMVLNRYKYGYVYSFDLFTNPLLICTYSTVVFVSLQI
jgi:hypothetical protein